MHEMINSIIEAISITLDAEFGYEIHTEEIKQDLTEPCFFIACLNPTTKLFLGKRYFRSNSFCIQYFPQSDEKQKECNAVAERMIWCLEVITVGSDPIRGTKMKYEVVDGVLQFFINYDCFVYRVEVTEAMETMGTSTSVKEGE
jgi:hypothetical protein